MKKNKAFTLIELLLVIVILSFLSYGAVTVYRKLGSDARRTVARQQQASLQSALLSWATDMTTYNARQKAALDPSMTNSDDEAISPCHPDTIQPHPTIYEARKHYNENMDLQTKFDCLMAFIDVNKAYSIQGGQDGGNQQVDDSQGKIFSLSTDATKIETPQTQKLGWHLTLSEWGSESGDFPKVIMNIP